MEIIIISTAYFFEGCGHCKRAKPEFTIAADTFKDDPRVGLAAVDCTQYKSVCSTYDIKGFPTFKYFSYLKTHREYTGGRSVSIKTEVNEPLFFVITEKFLSFEKIYK